jgi:hypothetical protein
LIDPLIQRRIQFRDNTVLQVTGIAFAQTKQNLRLADGILNDGKSFAAHLEMSKEGDVQ